MRSTLHFEEWIQRCEETIGSYLENCYLDKKIIHELNQNKDEEEEETSVLGISKELEALNRKKEENVVNDKVNEMVMGKLSDDMKFLDSLASHPALKENIFSKDQRDKDLSVDDKILHTIQG